MMTSSHPSSFTAFGQACQHLIQQLPPSPASAPQLYAALAKGESHPKGAAEALTRLLLHDPTTKPKPNIKKRKETNTCPSQTKPPLPLLLLLLLQASHPLLIIISGVIVLCVFLSLSLCDDLPHTCVVCPFPSPSFHRHHAFSDDLFSVGGWVGGWVVQSINQSKKTIQFRSFALSSPLRCVLVHGCCRRVLFCWACAALPPSPFLFVLVFHTPCFPSFPLPFLSPARAIPFPFWLSFLLV